MATYIYTLKQTIVSYPIKWIMYDYCANDSGSHSLTV